jgi:hypothetical protein
MATDIDHFRALAAPASSMRQNLGHRRAKFARTGSHGQAVGFHDFRLFGGAAAACRNDRARSKTGSLYRPPAVGWRGAGAAGAQHVEAVEAGFGSAPT